MLRAWLRAAVAAIFVSHMATALQAAVAPVTLRDGIGGYWQERNVVFDAAAMKAGDNVLTLTIPGGGLANGILYDYLRLEVDENATVN